MPRKKLLLSLLLISAAACSKNAAETIVSGSGVAPENVACSRGGFLEASFVGALSASVDWGNGILSCEGMPRPEGRGARLRFAGPADSDGEAVAVIIALPELERGATATELATNATVIVEGSGRFFSTSSTDICWTDVIRQEPLSADRYAIAGSLYCIAPLVEVNGDESLTIAELSFSGLLDWSAK